MNVTELAPIRERIRALEARAERERRRAERNAHAVTLLDRILAAPDLDAMYVEIEAAQDDFAAMFRRGE